MKNLLFRLLDSSLRWVLNLISFEKEVADSLERGTEIVEFFVRPLTSVVMTLMNRLVTQNNTLVMSEIQCEQLLQLMIRALLQPVAEPLSRRNLFAALVAYFQYCRRLFNSEKPVTEVDFLNTQGSGGFLWKLAKQNIEVVANGGHRLCTIVVEGAFYAIDWR